MKYSCLLMALLIAGVAGHRIADGAAEPVVPIIEEGIPLVVGVPEKRLQVVYHKVRVRQPVTQTVLVPEKRSRKVVRPVFRKVTRVESFGQMMLVPVKVKEKRVRMVYEEQRRTVLESRLTYVAEKTHELQTRQLYREVRNPKRIFAYVPTKTTRLQTRMVYAEEKIPMTRMRSEIRMVDEEIRDPDTGKITHVQKPVCDSRQVTEMVKRIVLRPETVAVPVTDYHLEERLDRSHKDYVPVWEQLVVPVTRYRPEMRTRPREVKDYVLVPREVEEMVTHYEMRPGPKKIDDYHLVWEEAILNETTYRPETRTEMREVEVVVPCVGEVIVTVSRMQPTLAGAAAEVHNGQLCACGARGHAPAGVAGSR